MISTEMQPCSKVGTEFLKKMSVPGVKIYYGNALAAQEIYDEVFIHKIYDFETDKKKPVIIDAGSHIGIAMLFFKQKYPLAKITCFEPDPNTFFILQKNIRANNLDDVLAINAALSKSDGVTYFYGEISGINCDTRGNSIIDAWGTQRATSKKILVNTKRLSSYIQEEIDFLKIDIEGSEQQVLEELGDKLHFVKEIAMEVHETQTADLDNRLEKIKSILNYYHFTVTTEAISVNDLLPQQVQTWIKQVNPVLTMLKAKKHKS